jgi:hypothetical protein
MGGETVCLNTFTLYEIIFDKDNLYTFNMFAAEANFYLRVLRRLVTHVLL